MKMGKNPASKISDALRLKNLSSGRRYPDILGPLLVDSSGVSGRIPSDLHRQLEVYRISSRHPQFSL